MQLIILIILINILYYKELVERSFLHVLKFVSYHRWIPVDQHLGNRQVRQANRLNIQENTNKFEIFKKHKNLTHQNRRTYLLIFNFFSNLKNFVAENLKGMVTLFIDNNGVVLLR